MSEPKMLDRCRLCGEPHMQCQPTPQLSALITMSEKQLQADADPRMASIALRAVVAELTAQRLKVATIEADLAHKMPVDTREATDEPLWISDPFERGYAFGQRDCGEVCDELRSSLTSARLAREEAERFALAILNDEPVDGQWPHHLFCNFRGARLGDVFCNCPIGKRTHSAKKYAEAEVYRLREALQRIVYMVDDIGTAKAVARAVLTPPKQT